MNEGDLVGEVLDFVCPRCEQSVSSAFYGPCSTCRQDLRASFAGQSRDIEAVAYEPKMNVVPNQVASKD